MKVIENLKTFLNNSFKILVSIVILILIFIPTFVTVLLPIYTYRYFISNWSKLFIPSHGKILPTINSIFAVDNITSDPSCSILLTVGLEGRLSVQEVKQRLQKLLATNKYAELQKSLTKWMGFFFWKSDPNFYLDDHVISITEPMGDEDILKLKKTLLKKPYVKGKPLWDFTIVTNYTGTNLNTKSICFSRFHHALIDGFSLYNLNSQLSDCPSKWVHKVQKTPTNNKGTIQNLGICLNLIAFGPFEFVSSMIRTLDKNEWKLKPESVIKDGIFAETSVLFSELKSIAKGQEVCLSAVLFASYTGAMRKMMMKYANCKVPDDVTIVSPFPMPGHPEDKLRIHVTMAPIKAPVGTKDPIERLQLLQKEFDKLKKSTLPLAYYYSVKILGALFPWMIKLFISKGNGMGTGILTNFAAPQDQVDVFGCVLTGLSVVVGVAHGTQSSGCAFVSYGGRMGITTGFDKALFSKQEMADEFLEFILKEFDILKEVRRETSVKLQIDV